MTFNLHNINAERNRRVITIMNSPTLSFYREYDVRMIDIANNDQYLTDAEFQTAYFPPRNDSMFGSQSDVIVDSAIPNAEADADDSLQIFDSDTMSSDSRSKI